MRRGVPGSLTLRVAQNETGVPRSAQQLAWLQTFYPPFTPFDNAWRGPFTFAKINGRLSSNHQWLASYTYDVVTLGGAQSNEAAEFRHVMSGGPGVFARVSSNWTPTLTTRMSIGYNGKKQENRNLRSDLTGVLVYQKAIASGGRMLGTGPLAALDASPFPGIDYNVHMWTIAGDALLPARMARRARNRYRRHLQPVRAASRLPCNNDGFSWRRWSCAIRTTLGGSGPFIGNCSTSGGSSNAWTAATTRYVRMGGASDPPHDYGW